MIHGINSWERRVSCIVHPQAEGIVHSEKFGGIRTEVGPAGYVLQSGERVNL